jgi:hypothetical protein
MELSPVNDESGSAAAAITRPAKPVNVASSRIANRNKESVESASGLGANPVTAVMSELLAGSGRTLLSLPFCDCQIHASHCQALPCAGQRCDFSHVFRG